jgi:hypothetical protein
VLTSWSSAPAAAVVNIGCAWKFGDAIKNGIRKSPHFALSVSAACPLVYPGQMCCSLASANHCKPADSVPLGEQLQIDFAERRVEISGVTVKVFLFVATLGYSRRLHVQSTTMVAIDYG